MWFVSSLRSPWSPALIMFRKFFYEVLIVYAIAKRVTNDSSFFFFPSIGATVYKNAAASISRYSQYFVLTVFPKPTSPILTFHYNLI